jgi:short-subunit dehydrogenase
MTKTIAIFGAGTGLGASVAARFGREGYRVALVARRKAALDELVSQLAKDGVDAAAFPSDLTDFSGVPGLVRSIEERLGGIDVAICSPVTLQNGFVPAAQLDAAKLEPLAKLFLFAPIELAHALIPGLVARGGAFILGGGLTAIHAIPGLSGVGPAMAAARNYVITLNMELKDRGVYAGTVTIGAVIERSAAHTAMAANGQLLHFPVISPDVIADEIWALVTTRDRVEAILPPLPAK